MIKIYIEEVIEAKINSEPFIRRILSDYLKVNRDELNIKKTKYGKPYLADYDNVHFNATHTRDIIVGAISDKAIGIDIEKIKTFNKRIAEKFFTEDEKNYIFYKKGYQDQRFLEIWTRKEAYVKWLGIGMGLSLDTFGVLRDDRITTTFIKGYILSICSDYMRELKDAENVNFYFNEKFV